MVTAAALIMICVFMAFVFGGQRTIAEFGIGLAAAVAVDAFVLRTVLVPALMHLFGKANWWLPARLDRILPRFSIEDASPPAPAPGRPRETRPASPVPSRSRPPRTEPLSSRPEASADDRRQSLPEPRKHNESVHPRRYALTIAYLWWFFLGLFGAHHFHLGRNRLGRLYPCTAGVCGLGRLLDPFLLPRQVRDAKSMPPAGSFDLT